MDDVQVEYFNVTEVLIQLIKFSDRSNWPNLYLTYKDIMNDPIVIKQLQDANHLNGNYKTFAEFLYDYDLHNTFWRNQLCVSHKQMILRALARGIIQMS